MKKAKLNGKDIYYNENKKCWCYMNHRPIPSKSHVVEDTSSGSVGFTTKLVNFFKGEK